MPPPWPRSARSTPATGSEGVIKVVTLFLVFMVVLAMFGRLWLPGVGMKRIGKCKDCGRFRIGSGPCDCGRG